MQPRLLFAVLAALGTGAAIAGQATLNGRVGSAIGPVRTGLLVNVAGGLIGALVFVGILLLARGVSTDPTEGAGSVINLPGGLTSIRQNLPRLAAAGFLGVVIITGISFSVGNLGVTAGLAGVLLSQLVVGLFLDGAGPGVTIAIDLRRVLGILAMGVGVWLLLPRTQ